MKAIEISNVDSILSMINGGMNVFEFQNMYPIKPLREKALRGMTNEEIDEIIASCGTAQGKAYYASFKN